jgi:hypothetical protein
MGTVWQAIKTAVMKNRYKDLLAAMGKAPFSASILTVNPESFKGQGGRLGMESILDD